MAPAWWQDRHNHRYQEVNTTDSPVGSPTPISEKMSHRSLCCDRTRSRACIMQTFFFAVLAVLSVYGLVSLARPPPAQRVTMQDTPFQSVADPDITEIVRELYKPLIPPADMLEWESIDANVFKVEPENVRYTEPLLKNVLILDVDTRAGKKRPVDMGYEGPMKWADVARLSSGYMNHYLYSLIHGYDYQMIIPESKKGYHPTWAKVPAIAEKIKEYRFVVFMDADALMHNLEVPLEWLMNYWNIDETKALTMAKDPLGKINQDIKGKPNLNTGFIIAQQTPQTAEIFEAWLACPDDEEGHPGCGKFKTDWPHEQAVMSSYIRWDYREHIKQLPCTEANGSPDFSGKCDGTLVSHWWYHKARVNHVVGNQMAQVVAERVHAHYIEEKPIHRAKDSKKNTGDKKQKKKKGKGGD